MQISPVMTSTRHTLNQMLIRYDKRRYLNHIVSEVFHYLQYNSTKWAPQYELNSLVTMATYWVPDLPNNKGISGHLWHFILISANGASYAWSNKHITMLAQVCILISCFASCKSLKYWDQMEKSELPCEHNFYI